MTQMQNVVEEGGGGAVRVRGEAGEGQAASAEFTLVISLPLILLLVLVPVPYYFAAVWRDRLIVLPCGGNADGKMLHSSLIPHYPTHFFPLLFPIPNESRELIRKI